MRWVQIKSQVTQEKTKSSLIATLERKNNKSESSFKLLKTSPSQMSSWSSLKSKSFQARFLKTRKESPSGISMCTGHRSKQRPSQRPSGISGRRSWVQVKFQTALKAVSGYVSSWCHLKLIPNSFPESNFISGNTRWRPEVKSVFIYI